MHDVGISKVCKGISNVLCLSFHEIEELCVCNLIVCGKVVFLYESMNLLNLCPVVYTLQQLTISTLIHISCNICLWPAHITQFTKSFLRMCIKSGLRNLIGTKASNSSRSRQRIFFFKSKAISQNSGNNNQLLIGNCGKLIRHFTV